MAFSGVGSFVLPGITEIFLKNFGTSGTFLLLSGLVLNSVPAAMLLKAPKVPRESKNSLEIKELDEESIPPSTEKRPSLVSYFPNKCPEGTFSSELILDVKTTGLKEQTDKVNKKIIDNETEINRVHKETILSKNAVLENKSNHDSKTASDYDIERYINEKNGTNKNKAVHLLANFDASDEKSFSNATKNDFNSEVNQQTIEKSQRRSRSKSRNLRVFTDPAYILILIACTGITIPVMTLYTIIVDASRDKGILEDVAILMTFAIADTIGRFAFGSLADLRFVSVLNLYAICCGSTGLLLILFTWLNDFYLVFAFFAVVGTLMGGVITLLSGVIRVYIPNEDLTMAFASRTVFFGLFNLLQPPVIGEKFIFLLEICHFLHFNIIHMQY